MAGTMPKPPFRMKAKSTRESGGDQLSQRWPNHTIKAREARGSREKCAIPRYKKSWTLTLL